MCMLQFSISAILHNFAECFFVSKHSCICYNFYMTSHSLVVLSVFVIANIMTIVILMWLRHELAIMS